MARLRASRRRRRPRSRKMDMTAAREMVQTTTHWFSVGIVKDIDGDGHTDRDAEDVVVEVELQPSLQPLLCRLMAPVGGPDAGLWKVPKIGDEVAVAIPGGEPECGGVILGMLSTGQVPAELDDDNQVLANPSGNQLLRASGDTDIQAGGNQSMTAGGNQLFTAGGSIDTDATGGSTISVGTELKLGGPTAVDFLVKGTTYRAAEDVLFGLISAAAATIASDPFFIPLQAPTKAAWAAVVTGVTTFLGASATYLSTKVDTE